MTSFVTWGGGPAGPEEGAQEPLQTSQPQAHMLCLRWKVGALASGTVSPDAPSGPRGTRPAAPSARF